MLLFTKLNCLNTHSRVPIHAQMRKALTPIVADSKAPENLSRPIGHCDPNGIRKRKVWLKEQHRTMSLLSAICQSVSVAN